MKINTKIPLVVVAAVLSSSLIFQFAVRSKSVAGVKIITHAHYAIAPKQSLN